MLLDFVVVVVVCYFALLFFVCLLFDSSIGWKYLVNLVNLTEWIKQQESRMSNCSCILEFF